MHGRHPWRFAWRSMVWENWFLPCNAVRIEGISKSVVGFLKLPFSSLSARRRFEVPISFE